MFLDNWKLILAACAMYASVCLFVVYKYGMIVRAEAESRGMHFADARVIAVFGMLVAIVFLSVGTGILCLVISQIFKFFRQAVPEEQPKEPLMLVADLRN